MPTFIINREVGKDNKNDKNMSTKTLDLKEKLKNVEEIIYYLQECRKENDLAAKIIEEVQRLKNIIVAGEFIADFLKRMGEQEDD